MNDKQLEQSGDTQTCWTLIQAAMGGSQSALNQFALRYQTVVRNTLAARWARSRRLDQVDDAMQEVFIECIRPAGALSKVEPNRPGGFRGYLYGVIRNVMLRHESRPLPTQALVEECVADEGTVGAVFDREYAHAILRDASQRQRELAKGISDAAIRRVELLHLKFNEGLPIREIAARWEVDTDWLHRQYSKARSEFLEALLAVVAENNPSATPVENKAACRELLGML